MKPHTKFSNLFVEGNHVTSSAGNFCIFLHTPVYLRTYSLSLLQCAEDAFTFNFLSCRELVMTVNIPVQERNTTTWNIATAESKSAIKNCLFCLSRWQHSNGWVAMMQWPIYPPSTQDCLQGYMLTLLLRPYTYTKFSIACSTELRATL